MLTISKRVAECTQTPVVTLKNGILIDQDNRQGEVVINHQFQFDKPLQTAIYQTGFCINQNNTLSIGGSAIFYSCISGTFSNLYNANIGSVCSQVYLDTVECVGGIASGTSSPSGSSATSSASSSTQSASSASSTPVATTPTTTPATIPATTPSSTPATTPATSASLAPVPYPVGNSTTAAGTASAGLQGSTSASTSTSAGTSKTSPAAYQPSSGANVLAMGGQVLAGVAAIGAYALF